MVKIEDYGDMETAWCPGCGNFGIRKALIKALVEKGLAPQDILLVSGIGQAAKTPHYIPCNAFNGLHGRGLPAATGAALAHPGLKVILTSGDGCNYGEGGNPLSGRASAQRGPDHAGARQPDLRPDQGPGQPHQAWRACTPRPSPMGCICTPSTRWPWR